MEGGQDGVLVLLKPEVLLDVPLVSHRNEDWRCSEKASMTESREPRVLSVEPLRNKHRERRTVRIKSLIPMPMGARQVHQGAMWPVANGNVPATVRRRCHLS